MNQAATEKTGSEPREDSERARILFDQLTECALNLHYAGKVREAIVVYQHILTLQPNSAKIHNNLAVGLKSLGQAREAVKHYREAIRIAPGYPEAYNNLGNAYRALERSKQAIECFNKALAMKPDYPEAHYNLGNVLKDIGRNEAAIEKYNKALALKPAYAEAYNDLGIAHQGLGNVDFAIECYKKSLALKPDYAEAYNNLGTARQMLGSKEEAIAGYRKAIQLKPDYAAAWRQLAMVAPGQCDLQAMEKLLARSDLGDEDRLQLHFAFGEVFNAGKEYEKAFRHYHAGNRIKYRLLPFNSKAHKAMIERLIKTYTADLIKDKSGYGMDTRVPVFILGMPRSGTTLVEQILSSHPRVFGAGELGYLTGLEKGLARRLKTRTPYPECAAELTPDAVQALAAEYLQKIRTLSADAPHITDKMPDNFLRIGLIKILYPGARIIHCRRNAMDTCTSIYLRLFTSRVHSYSYDFAALSTYYLGYERLMNHWHGIPGDGIFSIQYEALVGEPEKHIRELLAYVGLDWDDRCLAFHENKRAVLTASNQQVRRPIYSDSIDRWKRYGKGIEALAGLLTRN